METEPLGLLNLLKNIMRRFKKLEIEDLKEILEWRNHPSVRLSMFKQNKIKWEEHLNWFEKRSNQEEIYDLLYLESNQNVGFMSFDCSNDNDTCEWGFYLNPFTKQGRGLNLGYDGIEYCFKNLNVEMIIGNVLSSNEKSRKFHEKLGFSFIKETHMANSHGNIETKYNYSLLRDDWMKSRLSIKTKINDEN